MTKVKKKKLSKSFLQAEDGNIPLQQQKGYEYSGLDSKLTSQSSACHSLLIDNRSSNDLSDEYRSPRLFYDIHRVGQLGAMNFPAKRESLDKSQTATDVFY